MDKPYVLLDDYVTSGVRYYYDPVEIVQTSDPDDLLPCLEQLEDWLSRGFFIAGYLSYEAGYALEPKLKSRLPENRPGPLLQFGVFTSVSNVSPDAATDLKYEPINLQPIWSEADYAKRFDTVLKYIEAGDVYQINLTFPMTGDCHADPLSLYASLRHRQAASYGGIIHLGGADILSLSPELFFRRTGQTMQMQPMKGTVRRQSDPVQDAALKEAMRQDVKSRAENLMIVDLLRNDLSRIAQTGSVKVPELFALETYPTLHQMTSRVEARLRDGVSLRDIFRSLFPCGSVTGAPKIRAMEIIEEVEDTPRGAYCGSLGFVDPDGQACFNVAIRTLTLKDGRATYNVGSGIVLDSQASDEYAECLLKAKVMATPAPDLIETFRWEPGEGVVREPAHLDRLVRSAKALNYPCDLDHIRELLLAIESPHPLRVRLTLSELGNVHVETTDYEPATRDWSVSLCAPPLTPQVQETRYKISHREFYDGERHRIQSVTACDEVLFFNADNQLCEGSFTSAFVKKDDTLFTPPLTSGLLPGVLRRHLIDTGKAVETLLYLQDLKQADQIFVGNSLRGLIPVILTGFDRL